jgi:hypothetical protein
MEHSFLLNLWLGLPSLPMDAATSCLLVVKVTIRVKGHRSHNEKPAPTGGFLFSDSQESSNELLREQINGSQRAVVSARCHSRGCSFLAPAIMRSVLAAVLLLPDRASEEAGTNSWARNNNLCAQSHKSVMPVIGPSRRL